jgi:type IV pilus assembly protein PilM
VRGSSWLAPAPPRVAIEIASHRVTVVGLTGSSDRPVVDSGATEPLPPGAVAPALTGANIVQPGPVADALKRALAQAGLASARRAALVIPDSVARVSLLPFERLPERPADLEQLVRWQLRKATPFPLEEAQVTHFTASRQPPAATLAAVVARREVVQQYEAVATAAGLHAGLVDLASFNAMNALMAARAGEGGDALVVHLAAEATVLAILRGDQLLFYRHRAAVDEEPLGSLVHQTAMYHEDRLGGAAFQRVWLAGDGAAADPVRQEITARLGVPVESVDVTGLASLRAAGAGGAGALVAPIGALMRERRVA